MLGNVVGIRGILFYFCYRVSFVFFKRFLFVWCEVFFDSADGRGFCFVGGYF